MGVMLQASYWDCPQAENREHQWWIFIKSKLPLIAQAGFTALWLPPANKAAGCSMAFRRNRVRWIPTRYGQGLRWVDGSFDSGTARAQRWLQFQTVRGWRMLGQRADN
jgi:hypothetical protein